MASRLLIRASWSARSADLLEGALHDTSNERGLGAGVGLAVVREGMVGKAAIGKLALDGLERGGRQSGM